MSDIDRRTTIQRLEYIKSMEWRDWAKDALQFAIDSLEVDEAYQLEYEQPEFCADCISREDAKQAINDYWGEMYNPSISGYINCIDKLPSVYPKSDKLSDGYYRREYLRDLGKDICHQMCVYVHGKDGEECPCLNQTTSCLANIRVCDADRAIGKVIDRKIEELPSVYPKSDKPSGKWIHHDAKDFIYCEHWECSNCHRSTMTNPMVKDNDYNNMYYCPKCGVRMMESEDKEQNND